MSNSWVEVSKKTILSNLAQYQKVVGPQVAIMPIVKSNAYGHGMIAVAKLVAPKVKWIGVVNLAEGLVLRQNGIRKRIMVLSYCQPELLEGGIKQNIELPIYDLSQARVISSIAKKIKKIARVHVKVDTGATRIGILASQASDFIKKISQLPNIKIEGIFSHFAASEENKKYTRQQLAVFNQILIQLEKSKIKIPYQHFACSAATLVEKKSHFNLIRLGLGLYGLWPSGTVKKIAQQQYPWLKLKPALSWKTNIIQVKDIPAGTKVGYGLTYTAKKRMRIAVLPVGYFEGYDRRLGNFGRVLIKGKYCPVIGRICMNLMMVDISGIKEVKVSDEVVLLGQQGKAQINAEELAEKIGTINYEVVTRINPVLTRVYLQ